MKVAAAHPDVVVVQQGNVDHRRPSRPNIGTYFGTVYEPVYLAGIAAGKATKTNKLGYVYAFPIPQTIDNINAFELGAQSVNPAAQTYVVNTSNWCDPAKQAEAAKSLLAQGVDVITQHQDCTATSSRPTEAAGKFTVGYHADASSLAPKGWLTGSRVGLGHAVHRHRADRAGRQVHRLEVQRQLPGRPARPATTRSSSRSTARRSPTDTKTEITAALDKLKAKGASVFTGPIKDQSGKVVVAEGTALQYGDPAIEGMDWFVDGVVGTLAK